MAGSGKSEVAKVFMRRGCSKVRFGDITDREIARRGLTVNEANERMVRQELRQEHGMAAYAKLIMPDIQKYLGESDVVADGLYSWEEYRLFKDMFGPAFRVVAVWSAPETRYARLARRTIRPLTREEAVSRDIAEIENVNKGGPIAMAEFTLINESTMDELESQADKVVSLLR
jgi:dephospho-CoA kinase